MMFIGLTEIEIQASIISIEVTRKNCIVTANIINSLTLQACTLHESTAKCPTSSYIKISTQSD